MNSQSSLLRLFAGSEGSVLCRSGQIVTGKLRVDDIGLVAMQDDERGTVVLYHAIVAVGGVLSERVESTLARRSFRLTPTLQVVGVPALHADGAFLFLRGLVKVTGEVRIREEAQADRAICVPSGRISQSDMRLLERELRSIDRWPTAGAGAVDVFEMPGANH